MTLRRCRHGNRYVCRACAARRETLGLAAALIEQARTILKPLRAPATIHARVSLRHALRFLGGRP